MGPMSTGPSTLLERLRDTELSDEASELLRAGAWEANLETATADALERIAGELSAPIVHFPRLGALGGFDGGTPRMLKQMASALNRFELAERNG